MKREREKHITRLHIILFFIVVTGGLITYFAIKTNKAKEMEAYKNFEKDVVVATKNYRKINAITVKEGYEVQVCLSTLVKNNFISNELTKECDGYTVISNNKTLDGDYEEEYTSYIKCSNKYMSDNYSDEYMLYNKCNK